MRGASRRRSTAVLALFALSVIAIPVELAVSRLYAEPYPALFQPSFAGVPVSGDGVPTVEPTITVTLADGGVAHPSVSELLPADTDVLPSIVLSKALRPATDSRAAETRAWFAARLERLYPGRGAQTLRVEWHSVAYSVASGKRHDLGISRTETMTLTGAGRA